MLKDIFKQIILNNQEKDYSYLKERDYSIDFTINKIHCFTGVRRCGKTHLMFLLMKKYMLEHGKESVLYINFEDDRIFSISLPDLGNIIDAYYELFPNQRDKHAFFFFDEIQQVENWEKFIRRIYDTEKCTIFLSGSSAKLLSKEIATALRGRSNTTEVFPLSFKEFLIFKTIDFSIHTSKNISRINNALIEYLRKGGFPELANAEYDTAINAIQEYINLIVYRDLIERHKVSNVFLLKHLLKICFTNTAELLSCNKIYLNLRSQGLSVARNTIYEYINYLEDAYALFSVPFFSKSIRTQLRNPRKIYTADTGFKTALSFSDDIGKMYETAVFLNFRKTNRNIFYFKNIQEVDFYLPDKNILVNVCYNIDSTKTYCREVNGLLIAMNELNINTAYLVNATINDAVKKNDKTIFVIPLWRWLLEK